MRLNLGCGNQRRDGWLNVDRDAGCDPDMVVDLEEMSWPFEDSSADEVILHHVLEHLGESSRMYLAIIQELYRVCRNDALIDIQVPHPRHDDFLMDPTHVRAILPEQFQMFSKRLNKEWREEGAANTLLAEQLDVDFEVEKVEWVLDDKWLKRLEGGEISSDQLADMAEQQYNIVKEVHVVLRVVKN